MTKGHNKQRMPQRRGLKSVSTLLTKVNPYQPQLQKEIKPTGKKKEYI